MMALTGLLLLELGLYASCFVCGIVAAASITIVQGNFGGLCVLYGLVNYNTTASLIGVQSSSAPSLCYFVSAISVLVAVVCFSLSMYWVYTFCIDGDIRRERVWMNLIVVVCGVFLFFLLITGCMLKIGRDSLCNSVIHTVPNITRCEEAQTKNWVSPLKGGRFYNSLHKAEMAVWVNFFFWLIIGVLVIVQRRQSSGSKVIVGGYGGPAGGLFGDPGVTAAETEPFFNRPPRPQ
ncbi:transmembrane protein 179B [Lates calcarifer]|uniref:Transmembrane protein 179B n=1 Tax=Lates calcarifer TaxID=8187 RepID=A0A4W6ELC9_LATCA|nr:transmembrane protein 179B [Lates calcarifer]XP_018546662.1 transmembrane protein 179B [Lates calcarifer]